MYIFIAGPMSGYENFNYEEFNETEAFLLNEGYKVINPAGNYGGDQSLPWKAYLAMTVLQIRYQADAVVLLDGWEKSKGARREVKEAKNKGIPINTLASLRDKMFKFPNA